ncbi:MAG: hypothetical protein QM831_06595 [Kofleriaceae bacterium]
MRQVVVALMVSGCFFKPSPERSNGDDAGSIDAVDLDAPPRMHDGAYRDTNYIFVSPMPVQSIGTTTTKELTDLCTGWASGLGLARSDQYIAAVQHTGDPQVSELIGAETVGFYRLDDQPVGSAWSDMTAGKILYPPNIDLNGAPVAFQVFTGIDLGISGTQGNDCSLGQGRFGFSFAGGRSWLSERADRTCNPAEYFYCVGRGANDPLGPVASPPNAQLAWITVGATFNGKDVATTTNCNGLPNATVLAYNSSGQLINTPQGGPWYRADGVNLGMSLEQPAAPITTTDGGGYVADTETAWLGHSNVTCTNWSTMDNVTKGTVVTIDNPVGSTAQPTCNTPHHLICFQQ